jgi:uncharacterized protein (DUF736 family)
MVAARQQNGDHHGYHRNLHLSGQRLHRIGQDAHAQRQGEVRCDREGQRQAPDYRIFAGATEFGAAWKKTARETEREYLSVKLDDPSFPAPIYASLVKGEADSFTLIWSRRNGD